MFRATLFLCACLPVAVLAESAMQADVPAAVDGVTLPRVPSLVRDYLPSALDWRSYYVNSLAVRMAATPSSSLVGDSLPSTSANCQVGVSGDLALPQLLSVEFHNEHQ